MPTPLETALENLATETWQRLQNIKAFLHRPEPFNMVRLGETTITDLAMMDLCRRGLRRSIFIQTPPDKERVHGTDFEWWIGSNALGWFRLAVQAKKLDMRRGRYLGLGHKVGGKPQIQVLQDYADDKKTTPLYCLYNYYDYSNMADPEKHWHCCQRPFRPEQLGCSIAPASRVSDAIDTWGKRSFEFIHECDQTLPWQCLASCPYVRNRLVQRETEANVSVFPLFDPRSYHTELPPFLGGQQGNLFSDRMRLPVDQDGVPGIDAEAYAPEIVDFTAEVAEHYRPLREQPDVIDGDYDQTEEDWSAAAAHHDTCLPHIGVEFDDKRDKARTGFINGGHYTELRSTFSSGSVYVVCLGNGWYESWDGDVAWISIPGTAH